MNLIILIIYRIKICLIFKKINLLNIIKNNKNPKFLRFKIYYSFSIGILLLKIKIF